MSTAELLSLISLICFVLSGVFLVLTIVLWFGFKIPQVISDLSGRTARRSIAKLRAENAKKVGTAKKKPHDAGGISVKSAVAKSPVRTEPAVQSWETGLLDANRAETVDSQATELLEDPEGTQPLVDEDATVPLTDENATVPLSDEDATELLLDPDATMPLVNEPVQPVKVVGGIQLFMLDDVMLIHTDEAIR